MKDKIVSPKNTLLGFILLSGLLAVINFSAVRSLWLDEALLGLNIVANPVSRLLQPLDHVQVAPIGFVLIEKFFSYVGGKTDWSLRIFPLISFLISIGLMYALSFRVFKEKVYALFATALYSLSLNILIYSSEAKQYMSDVTICLLILVCTMRFMENNDRNHFLKYSLLGALSIWFSNISIILLFTVALYVFYKSKGRKVHLKLFMVLSSWFISFAIYYFLFIHNHPTKPFQINYWSNANAFLPKNVLSLDFFKDLLLKITELFSFLGPRKLVIATIPLFCAGLLFFVIKKSNFLFVLVTPIIIHLILAYFKMYPFQLRLILYLAPIIVIIITNGIFHIFTYLKIQNLEKTQYSLVIPLIFSLIILGKRGFPIEKEEMKKALTYINSNFEKNDNIYVYYAASPAFLFYKKYFTKINNIKNEDIIFGEFSRQNWSSYEEKISQAKGPFWVLFSHVSEMKNLQNLDEEAYILELFKKNNFKIIDQSNYKGASAYKIIPK